MALRSYYQEHAQRCYDSIESIEVIDARKILELIRKKRLSMRFTSQDIYRIGLEGLKDSLRVKATLELLRESNWVAFEKIQGHTGKAAEFWVMHPKIFEIACQNAIKHGLLAKNLLIYDEDYQDLDAFSYKIHSTLSPQGAMEELLVDKIINAAWRLNRIMRIEVSIFHKKNFLHETRNLSDLFFGKSGECLQSLSRYETTLERNFYKAIHELQRIQSMRLGNTILAPISVEIDDYQHQKIGFVS